MADWISRRRQIIRALLLLIIAYLAQRIWMSELNAVVWKITYIGEQVALLVSRPDYDSAASVSIFETVAIVVNVVVFAVVLWPIQLLLNKWKQRRRTRKAART